MGPSESRSPRSEEGDSRRTTALRTTRLREFNPVSRRRHLIPGGKGKTRTKGRLGCNGGSGKNHVVNSSVTVGLCLPGSDRCLKIGTGVYYQVSVRPEKESSSNSRWTGTTHGTTRCTGRTTTTWETRLSAYVYDSLTCYSSSYSILPKLTGPGPRDVHAGVPFWVSSQWIQVQGGGVLRSSTRRPVTACVVGLSRPWTRNGKVYFVLWPVVRQRYMFGPLGTVGRHDTKVRLPRVGRSRSVCIYVYYRGHTSL